MAVPGEQEVGPAGTAPFQQGPRACRGERASEEDTSPEHRWACLGRGLHRQWVFTGRKQPRSSPSTPRNLGRRRGGLVLNRTPAENAGGWGRCTR